MPALYLPDTLTVDLSTLRALKAGMRSPEIEELASVASFLDLPINSG